MAVFPADDQSGDLLVYDRPPMEQQQAPQLVSRDTIQHGMNLVASLDKATIDGVSHRVMTAVEQDQASFKDWLEQIKRSIELLGLGDESKPDLTEYEKASTANSTTLIKSLIRFCSRVMPEMLPVGNLCNVEVIESLDDVPIGHQGEIRKEHEQVVDRVERFIGHYLTKRLRHYVTDHDCLLWNVGLTGVGFKKIYNLPTVDPVQIDRVSPTDLIVSPDARSLDRGRVTHRIKMPLTDFRRAVVEGRYETVDIPAYDMSDHDTQDVSKAQSETIGIDEDAGESIGYVLYECHCDLQIPGDERPDGVFRPYVVTIETQSRQVVSIRRNWRPNDVEERRIRAFVHYPFMAGDHPIYAYGLGHLLANPTATARQALRRMLEAGFLANHPGGLKMSGLTVRNDSARSVPGEFIDVDSPTIGSLQDAVMPFPFKGADPTLMALLERVDNDADELGGTALDGLLERAGPNSQVGTMMLAHDEMMQFQSAIHRRLYTSMEDELELFLERLRYGMSAGSGGIIRFDYNSYLEPTDLARVRITPAMRPGAATRQRRILEAQAVLEGAGQFPAIHDQRAVIEFYYEALGIEDYDHLMTQEEEVQPADPVSEYMRVLRGEPVKVGPAQDHESHINAHVAGLQMLSSSEAPVEQGEQAVAALQAHVAEHVGMHLAVEVARMLGMPLEAFVNGMPPEVEMQIAPAVAEAMAAIAQAYQGQTDEDVRITVARIQAENRLAIEQMKVQTAITTESMELQADREETAAKTERNIQDNQVYLIAQGLANRVNLEKARSSAKPSPTPSGGAGGPSPR